MNDNFIDEIGVKFNIYPKGVTGVELSRARQQLRERFEMFSTGGQSYKVSFAHKDPQVTYEVSKMVMNEIRSYFINTRMETIENAKKTIIKKLESIKVTKHITEDSISANALASKNPDVLNSEIDKIERDISALKMQFNSQHPRIVKLEQRKATILNWLREIKTNKMEDKEDEEIVEFTDAPLLMASDKELSETIAAKLYAKFNDINIALDIEKRSLSSYIGVIVSPQMPTSPLFPKKRLFASLGFMVGLIFCFIYVFYHEVMSMSPADQAKTMAADLGGDFFGTMPHVDEKALMTNKEIAYEEKKLLAYNGSSQ